MKPEEFMVHVGKWEWLRQTKESLKGRLTILVYVSVDMSVDEEVIFIIELVVLLTEDLIETEFTESVMMTGVVVKLQITVELLPDISIFEWSIGLSDVWW